MLIPWERRANWVWQIITTVTDIHKRGSIVGCLDISFVTVDPNDNISFHRFKSTSSHLRNQDGELPLEFRQATRPRTTASRQALTFQSDLFDLGLLVWKIAEHEANPIGAFC